MGGAKGTVEDPVPLADLLNEPLDLADVNFVPLTDAAGNTVGVGFPRAGEATVLQQAFQHGAGRDNAYTAAIHHDARGFAVTRRSDGVEVRLDENGLVRLLTSAGLPGGQGWRQSSELVLLSCRVADPALGNRLGSVERLLRQENYRGDLLGPDRAVTVFEDGRITVRDGGSMRTADGDLVGGSKTSGHGKSVTFVPPTQFGAQPAPRLTSNYRVEGSQSFESVPPLLRDRTQTAPNTEFPAFGRAAEHLITQDHPDLRTSGDNTLAINGTRSVHGAQPANEAHEFLATPEILDNAREALRRNGSRIGLAVADTRVVIDANGRRQTLHRVVPTMPGSISDVCREFSEVVHGGVPDALLFRDEHGNTAVAGVNTADSVEVTGAFHLAEGLAGIIEQGDAAALTPSRAADFAVRDDRASGADPGRPLPGASYGRTFNPATDPATRADFDAASRGTGINHHAWARPGEMYVRNSVPAEAADGTADYTVNASRDGEAAQAGYHFATVIAESADGRTQITLENYNHGGAMNRAVTEAIAGNLERYGGRLGEIAADLADRAEQARSAGDTAGATRLARHQRLAEALAAIDKPDAGPEAQRRARQAMAEELTPIPVEQQWHFKMYTREPGESFFEQQALLHDTSIRARGVNPLVTVALGGVHRIKPRSVGFDPGQRTATETQHHGQTNYVARKVARAAVLRHGLGLPLPYVTIVAAGDTPGLDPLLAPERAGHVREQFNTVLADELAKLQGDNGSVRPADIDVIATPAGAVNGPAPGTATVAAHFADSHDTPEGRAATDYHRATHGLGELAVPMADVHARVAEFGVLAAEGAALEQHRLPAGTRERLTSINDSLARLGDRALTEQVRGFVTEALLAATLVPTRDNQPTPSKHAEGGVQVDRHTIQPVSPARLTQLLRELDTYLRQNENPFQGSHSLVRDFAIPANASLPVRLATLGLLNLSGDGRAAVAASELFTALQSNPKALVNSLYSASGHEKQYFHNTCVAAAVNVGLRSRVPTLASMLHLGRSLATQAESRAEQAPQKLRDSHDRLFGRTEGQLVADRVTQARAEFDAIEQQALALAKDERSDAAAQEKWQALDQQVAQTMQQLVEQQEEWHALDERVARSMQKLAAADLSQGKAPVLTKVVDDSWNRSAAMSVPKLLDRPIRRFKGIDPDSYLGRIQPQLAMEPDQTRFGDTDQFDDGRGVALADQLGNPGELGAFWERVADNTGHVVTLPHHQVYLQATTADGQPVFILSDPKHPHSAQLTPEELARWATKNKAQVSTRLFPAPASVAGPATPAPAGVTLGPANGGEHELTAPVAEAPNRWLLDDDQVSMLSDFGAVLDDDQGSVISDFVPAFAEDQVSILDEFGPVLDRHASIFEDNASVIDDDVVFSALVDLSSAADQESGATVFGTGNPQPKAFFVDDLPESTRARADHLLGMDMTRTPTGDNPVVVERDLPSRERRFTWAGHDHPRIPPLPELLELPRLVHSVWLGGALRAAGAMAHFRDNIERTARAAGDRWKAVLWTDISRDKLLAALRRHLPTSVPKIPVRHGFEDDDQWDDLDLAGVADMYAWASGANIALVNVDEVFHEDEPMDLHDEYGAETARHTRRGYDNAAEIAANEILSRFGGVAVNPAHYAQDLTGAENVVRSAPGWARGDGAVAMPQGHPAADLYRDALRQHYPSATPTVPAMAGAPVDTLAPAGEPADLAGVLENLPKLDGFVPGDPATEPPPVGPLTELSVEDLSKRVIDVLVHELRASGGNLNLAAVADLVAGHPRAGEIWTVVLAFLATRPDLAELVRTVTMATADEAAVLPPRAAELIAFDPAFRPDEYARPATLNWPDWL